jgi:hypothetical protein
MGRTAGQAGGCAETGPGQMTWRTCCQYAPGAEVADIWLTRCSVGAGSPQRGPASGGD